MAGITSKALLPQWVRTIVIGRRPKWTIVRIAILVSVVAVLRVFVVVPVRVEGISMEPNFRNNSINFIYLLAYTRNKPQRGDVVCVYWLGSPTKLLKRIVALPGETMAFSRGHLLINDKILDEPYVRYSCDWSSPARTLGPDEYFIVGDNRSMLF